MVSENVTEVFRLMPKRFAAALSKISENQLSRITEIRLRVDKPVILVFPGMVMFLTEDGPCPDLNDSCMRVSRGELVAIFERLCDYSVYSQNENLVNGFVTMSCGNRVGIAATAVMRDNIIHTIKDVSSLNFRISREVADCSEKLFTSVFSTGAKSVIIAGPPGSGKTTIMRDICKKLSSGRLGKYYKVAVVDERREIACVRNGACTKDVGFNTDVLDSYPKGKGIEIALRVLSPEIIACDEIGSVEEVSQIISGINSGVKFVLSVHASSEEELYRRVQIVKLLKTREFQSVVLLGSAGSPGTVKEIINFDEVCHEVYNPPNSKCGSGSSR